MASVVFVLICERERKKKKAVDLCCLLLTIWCIVLVWNHSLVNFQFLFQALVDAPDMVRAQMNFKRLSLTDIKIDINRIPKKKTLVQAMETAGEL